MKPKADFYKDYNEQLDTIALEAMSCILRGTFAHPIILQQMDEIAKTNNRAMTQEVAIRAYEQAAVMLQTRKQYLKIEKGEGSKGTGE